MKKYSFILAATAIAMTVSCAEKAIEIVPAEGMKNIEIAVSMDDTKAALDGQSVVWKDGDKVAVFDGINEAANEFTVSGASGKTAFISGSVSEQAVTLQAVYPFSAATSAVGDTVKFYLNQPQVIPAGENIDPNALVSVAKANVGQSMSFKNVASLVKFEITEENVAYLLLTSNNSEKILGNAAAVINGSSVTIEGGSSSRMKIMPDGEAFAKGVYYATVLPGEIESGVSFVATTPSVKYVKRTDKKVSFVRSGGINFGGIIGTDTLPLNIATKADLDKWAANTSLYLKADVVKLTADIDCGGVEWTPVQNYYGGFDGQNHSIYNFKITESACGLSWLGFFHSLTNDNTVKDLKLGCTPTGEYDGVSEILVQTNNVDYAGALAAVVKNSHGADSIRISNIHNYIPVTIKKTTAETKAKAVRLGGIVGRVGEDTKVRFFGCVNDGAIKNKSGVNASTPYFGGIVAAINSNGVIVDHCTNNAEINMASASGGTLAASGFAGGMTGRTSSVDCIVFRNCTNNGKIILTINPKNSTYIGGILGMDNTAIKEGNYNIQIIDCVNNGEIGASSDSKIVYMGGMMGSTRAVTKISGCVNKGRIYKNANHNANSAYGGILGYSEGCEGAIVENCVNEGILEETGTVSNPDPKIHAFGGIVGVCNIDIVNCTNSGNITLINEKTTTLHCAGGIAGFVGLGAEELTFANPVIKNCKNTGNLSSKVNCPTGGLIGRINTASATSYSTGEGCVVNCTVTPGQIARGGMIVGVDESTGTTVGTATGKVKVAGSFNGTAIDASNFSTYLVGTGSTTFNAEYSAE